MNKKDLAAGVKQMRSVAKLLEQWAEDMEKATAPAGKDEKAAPTLPEIKKYLTEKCAAGYSAQVRAVIASFGASSLSGVSPDQYSALMEAASGIGGEADAG